MTNLQSAVLLIIQYRGGAFLCSAMALGEFTDLTLHKCRVTFRRRRKFGRLLEDLDAQSGVAGGEVAFDRLSCSDWPRP